MEENAPRKVDSHGDTEEGWTKVRRKINNKAGSLHTGDSDITSLYVVDVFIPNKKNKEGSFFCFIKFTGIKDGSSFELSLPNLNIRNNLLRVNLSKYPRKPPPPPRSPPKPVILHLHLPPDPLQNHANHASALLGKYSNTSTPIQMKAVSGMANWYSCTQNLFGTAESLEHLRKLPDLMKIEGGLGKYVYYCDNW
ncbi:hypothetical protein LXL04_021879 [Taraxacum kok-saghyz]